MSEIYGRISAGTRAKRGKSKFASPIDKATAVEVSWAPVSALFSVARPLERPSFIYVVSEGGEEGPVKIGQSREPISRLRAMQTGNSRPLRIEWVLLGSAALEKRLHGIWINYAVTSPRRQGKAPSAPGTEWFHPEIREELFPVVALAAEKQIAQLEEDPEDQGIYGLVLAAHLELGVSIEGPDRPRLLRRAVG